ncbi:MAG TPA: hypothetical protein DEF85_06295 [Clostridiaceae bacterium]|jgi:predicted AlkP superfamily pyrophosphatase or phosphodiesterase|nr:hypothetical protein [Clostridiaceae bacterium]HBF76516.1 hypothetical protein [Clostridiaceae bacterium]HBG38673.1 hypothetical protein [Clostridiaceae bacterium]HBN28416.1 hypothetical protein [Clostridiaceae bacterium]HBX48484.1 hypothetical protein [Clostridiaceae bacterium]
MKLKNFLYCILIYFFIVTSFLYIFENEFYTVADTKLYKNEKVCLIIVDGLRYDTSLKMPFINEMLNKNNGIHYRAMAETPSISRPGYERILTGSQTYINGITSNLGLKPSITPNLFSACKSNNLKTAACGFYWLKDLYSISIDEGYFYYYNDDKVFYEAEKQIINYSPNFLVVHPMKVDRAGHKFGGKSKEYDEVVYEIDSEIKNLYEVLYKNNYTLIITSDHGHKDKGGHGDSNIKSLEIPIIILSPDLNATNFKDSNNIISQRDIAPTICDLLKIPKTNFMTGHSLIIK